MELTTENGSIQAIQLNQSMESVNNEEEVSRYDIIICDVMAKRLEIYIIYEIVLL